MIAGLGYVVNNEGVIMCVTGTEPVYTRLCVKICHWDCIELDFCMFCLYNSLKIIWSLRNKDIFSKVYTRFYFGIFEVLFLNYKVLIKLNGRRY